MSSLPSSPLLALQGLRKDFGGLTAVNAIDLELKKGQITGLIGPNGAGKTTLFNLIAGMDTATSGRIYFAGKAISSLTPDKRCRLGIARTFQIPLPFAQMTVFENVKVGLLFGGVRPTGDLSEEIEKIVTEVGLERWTHSDTASLPLGARKRLEVARALATKPQLILLDEVMGGLRGPEIDGMITVVDRARASGITVIMIEHVMRAVMELADRIVVLHHGAVIADGTPENVTRNDSVIEAYLGGGAHATA